MSNANFKYLDQDFGSIQKLYSRDTDLVVFQENKVSKVLYEKNLLSDAVGGGTIASIPQVLGTQIVVEHLEKVRQTAANTSPVLPKIIPLSCIQLVFKQKKTYPFLALGW